MPYLDALLPPEHDIAPEEPEGRGSREDAELRALEDLEEKKDGAEGENKTKSEEEGAQGALTAQKKRSDPEVIDNPFLRQPKRPYYKKKKK